MRVIIQIIQSVLICYLMYLYVCEPLRCGNCPDFSQEQLRELRYEYFKKHILKKMHLPKAPQTNLPKPPLKSLLMIAEMTEKEMLLETNDDLKTESVIVYPENDNLTCSEFRGNESVFCNRLQYNVSESLFSPNFLFAEIWFYKPRDQAIRVYQIITDNFQNLTDSLELDNIEIETDKWRKYSVYKYNFNTIVLEVIQETEKSMEDVKPVLIIHSRTDDVSSRKKRNLKCEESSSSCCKENFFLNFSEIGWDNWILHPEGYQANFCRGRCFNDLNNTRFYHSSVLLSYIRDNKDIAEELGLNMCCTPSKMASLTILYINEKGLIFHKTIENMKVEACDCA